MEKTNVTAKSIINEAELPAGGTTIDGETLTPELREKLALGAVCLQPGPNNTVLVSRYDPRMEATVRAANARYLSPTV